MIKSMTSYATYEKAFEDISVTVEIKTYNGRFLDAVLKAYPYSYNIFEDKIKKIVSDYIVRGRVEIRLKIENKAPESVKFSIDKQKAENYYAALLEICETLNLNASVLPKLVLKHPGIIKPEEPDADHEKLLEPIIFCIKKALEDLNIMRKKEGDFIAADLKTRIAFIKEKLNAIEAEASEVTKAYGKKLMERIKDIVDMIDIDENRIAQESAIFADKSDITEEIVRARSHLKQFENFIDADASEGRKINFLIQELNREFNTIGSKTTEFKAASIVIEVKAELEKIREQIQNAE
ncbi:MAG: YicC family protein [Deltaproteobacteria bacterium]|nr:YicC family protein [Deltaproteobacteria bacterium]